MCEEKFARFRWRLDALRLISLTSDSHERQSASSEPATIIGRAQTGKTIARAQGVGSTFDHRLQAVGVGAAVIFTPQIEPVRQLIGWNGMPLGNQLAEFVGVREARDVGKAWRTQLLFFREGVTVSFVSYSSISSEVPSGSRAIEQNSAWKSTLESDSAGRRHSFAASIGAIAWPSVEDDFSADTRCAERRAPQLGANERRRSDPTVCAPDPRCPDRARPSRLTRADGRFHQSTTSGLHRPRTNRGHTEAKRLQFRHDFVAKHFECLGRVAGNKNAFPLGQQMSNEVCDRVRLAGSGRALNDNATLALQTTSDLRSARRWRAS